MRYFYAAIAANSSVQCEVRVRSEPVARFRAQGLFAGREYVVFAQAGPGLV